MTSSVSTQEIKGFSILPLKLAQTAKYSTKSPTIHYVYYKKHTINSRDSDELERASRSLFMINLPINTTLQSARKLFGAISTGALIETLTLANDYEVDIDLTKLTSDLELGPDKSKGFKLPKNCAILTFLDKSGLNLALQGLKTVTKRVVEDAQNVPDFVYDDSCQGSNYFYNQYKRDVLDPAELSEKVSQALVEFDTKEKESIENLQSQKSLVDEDGFTLVVGSHRKTKNGILGKVKLASTVENVQADRKLKKKEKEDFYRFQIREKKKGEMNELLRKFKDDQERIKIMKERKKFRPY